MGYMVVWGEDTKKIFLDEIAILMIENTAVSLTACLLEALVNKKIKVVFLRCKKKSSCRTNPYIRQLRQYTKSKRADK